MGIDSLHDILDDDAASTLISPPTKPSPCGASRCIPSIPLPESGPVTDHCCLQCVSRPSPREFYDAGLDPAGVESCCQTETRESASLPSAVPAVCPDAFHKQGFRVRSVMFRPVLVRTRSYHRALARRGSRRVPDQCRRNADAEDGKLTQKRRVNISPVPLPGLADREAVSTITMVYVGADDRVYYIQNCQRISSALSSLP